MAPKIDYPKSMRRLDALDTAELNLLILERSIAMIRPLGCFAALAIATLGSMPSSATDQTTTIAMHEPIAAHAARPAVLNAALRRAAPAPSDVSADIEIDKTSVADFSYRAEFQAERGFLELALADLDTAAQLVRDSRDDVQQKILMRAFDTTGAVKADGLKDGFSRVVEIKW